MNTSDNQPPSPRPLASFDLTGHSQHAPRMTLPIFFIRYHGKYARVSSCMRRPSPWYAAEKVIDWTPSLRLRRRVNDGRYSKVVLWFGQCSKMGHPLPRRETIRVAVVRRWAPTGCRSLCSKIRCRIKQSRERAANPPARSVSGRKPGGNSVVLGSVAETEGCLRTVVVWEGEAPAEPGCHSPPLLCTARMGHPRPCCVQQEWGTRALQTR